MLFKKNERAHFLPGLLLHDESLFRYKKACRCLGQHSTALALFEAGSGAYYTLGNGHLRALNMSLGYLYRSEGGKSDGTVSPISIRSGNFYPSEIRQILFELKATYRTLLCTGMFEQVL